VLTRPRRAARGRAHPHRPLAAVVALVVALAAVAAACSSDVDLGVEAVDARWIDVPGEDDRRALLVTPEHLGGGTTRDAAPLVVILHGLGQSAEHMAGIGGWVSFARTHEAVVVFGEGWEHSWNAGTCCGEASKDDVDDVGYLNRLIDEVVEETGADRDSVHMVGFSNGGMMTYRYLCEGDVRLKGAASIAGTNVDDCTPTRPTTFLQISGTADTIVPVDDEPSVDAELGPLEPVSEAIRGVARAFGCPAPKVSRTDPVTTTLWTPCDEGVTVRFDLVTGMLHEYPVLDDYQGTDQIVALWGLADRAR
jgi:polyhydroxybutyrate depolymerase